MPPRGAFTIIIAADVLKLVYMKFENQELNSVPEKVQESRQRTSGLRSRIVAALASIGILAGVGESVAHADTKVEVQTGDHVEKTVKFGKAVYSVTPEKSNKLGEIHTLIITHGGEKFTLIYQSLTDSKSGVSQDRVKAEGVFPKQYELFGPLQIETFTKSMNKVVQEDYFGDRSMFEIAFSDQLQNFSQDYVVISSLKELGKGSSSECVKKVENLKKELGSFMKKYPDYKINAELLSNLGL
jgi:hypothetical protein